MTPGESNNEWYHYYCSGFYLFKKNCLLVPNSLTHNATHPQKLWLFWKSIYFNSDFLSLQQIIKKQQQKNLPTHQENYELSDSKHFFKDDLGRSLIMCKNISLDNYGHTPVEHVTNTSCVAPPSLQLQWTVVSLIFSTCKIQMTPCYQTLVNAKIEGSNFGPPK